jgi:hypothetical protein
LAESAASRACLARSVALRAWPASFRRALRRISGLP